MFFKGSGRLHSQKEISNSPLKEISPFTVWYRIWMNNLFEKYTLKTNLLQRSQTSRGTESSYTNVLKLTNVPVSTARLHNDTTNVQECPGSVNVTQSTGLYESDPSTPPQNITRFLWMSSFLTGVFTSETLTTPFTVIWQKLNYLSSRFEPGFGKKVSKIAGNSKTGCPNLITYNTFICKWHKRQPDTPLTKTMLPVLQ